MPDQDELTADDFPSTRDSLAVRGELRAPEFHPSTAAFLKRLSRHGGLSDSVSVGYARRRFGSMTPLIATFPSVASVTDRNVAGPHGRIPVRMVYPHGVEVPRPVIVWFPGGGFVLGDLETGEPTARHLAMRTGAIVVCVNYRKAPEHPFPTAIEDSWVALEWVDAHRDELAPAGAPLIVAGDSAGGNISAVMTHWARDRNGPKIDYQVLVYPVTDCDMERPSYNAEENQLIVDRPLMEWFFGHYEPDAEKRKNPDISPIRRDSLESLPPAFIYLAEHDPLHDEGKEYAEKLTASGNEVECEMAEGQLHGFFQMANILPGYAAGLEKVASKIDEFLTKG